MILLFLFLFCLLAASKCFSMVKVDERFLRSKKILSSIIFSVFFCVYMWQNFFILGNVKTVTSYKVKGISNKLEVASYKSK